MVISPSNIYHAVIVLWVMNIGFVVTAVLSSFTTYVFRPFDVDGDSLSLQSIISFHFQSLEIKQCINMLSCAYSVYG